MRDRVLVEIARRSLIELRRQSSRQSALYQAQIRQLSQPERVREEDFVTSYTLDVLARILQPRFLVGSDPARPTLCTVCVGDAYTRAVEYGTRTKLEYCRRHGYNFVLLDTVPRGFERPLPWLKIPLLFHLAQGGHQRLFYLDADALITNPEIHLEPLCERLENSGRQMMIAEDGETINTGAFFLRGTWQARVLLDVIYHTATCVDHCWWEQYALIDLLNDDPVFRTLLDIEPDGRQFNSLLFEPAQAPRNPAEIARYQWQPGDFVCHLAGLRDHGPLRAKMDEVQARLG